MGKMVYVLLTVDLARNGDTQSHPIGVVTSEAVAESFYKADHATRDYVPFLLDEVPEISGEMSSYTPPKPVKPATPQFSQETMDNLAKTRKMIEEATQKLKSRDRKKTSLIASK